MQGADERLIVEPDHIEREVLSLDEPADESPPGVHMVPNGPLTAELRAEIEDILRSSSDGLSHGATFRLCERGLSVAEIAAERGVSVATTQGFLNSLDALLSGTIPNTKSAAMKNSYVYREILNHGRSGDLDSYVKTQLRKLKAINPDVSFEPLKTRAYQHGPGKPRQHRVGDLNRDASREESCPQCAAIGIIHFGEC